jgi:hypothetical protein
VTDAPPTEGTAAVPTARPTETDPPTVEPTATPTQHQHPNIQPTPSALRHKAYLPRATTRR